MTRNIIFLGAPGCGKGTQAGLLVRQLDFVKVSTGDLLREIAKEDSDYGRSINNILNKGILVGDDIVNDLIDRFYCQNSNKAGIIFDGYPRNIEQAVSLDQILKKNQNSVDAVFYFEVQKDTLIKRIIGRYICTDCGTIYNKFFFNTKKEGECDRCKSSHFNVRIDDTKEVIEDRLKVYDKSTAPLLDFYADKLIKIDAEQSADIIAKLIMNHLK